MTTGTATCPRCNGSGLLPRFGHIMKGLCFRCDGSGVVRVRLHRDGTVDHDHFIGYPAGDPAACVRCGLPVSEWPPVVVATWWANGYEVYLPSRRLVGIGDGETRRKAQNIVRRLVLAEVPNARIKWQAAQ